MPGLLREAAERVAGQRFDPFRHLFGTFSARFRAWRGGFEVQKGGFPRFDAAVVLLTVTHAVAVVIEDAESPLRVLRLLRVFRRWHSQAFSLDYEAKRNAFSASKP